MTIFLSWILLWAAPAFPDTVAPVPAKQVLQDSLPYLLEAPSQEINLVEAALREISGLSPTSEPGIFCAISDEKGEAFFLDGLGGGAVVRRVLFRDKGDFEGIELVDNCLYAIKSDGDLFEVKHWKRGKLKMKRYKTHLSKSDDVEGLGYDKKRKALLVACKGDPDSSYLRRIYAFDLRHKQLGAEPVFTIDPLEVNALVPYREGDKKHFFSPSGVAVHPLTNEVYVLSTSLKRLVVLDPATGKIRHAVWLDKHLLPQPEGIAFDPAGNLYLSSEGKKKEGLLLRFDYHKP